MEFSPNVDLGSIEYVDQRIAEKEKTVLIHSDVDIDAVLSVWLVCYLLEKCGLRREDINVQIVNGNISANDVPANAIALDISAGLKGEGSCFESLCASRHMNEDDRFVFLRVAQYVTREDNGHRWERGAFMGSVSNQMELIKSTWIAEGKASGRFDPALDDYLVHEWGVQTFDYFLKGGFAQLPARKASADAPSFCGGRVAVIDGGFRIQSLFFLERPEVDFLVFQDPKNNVIGVIRAAGNKVNLTELLKEELPSDKLDGFYLDDAHGGFMVKWKDNQDPVTDPCPISTEWLTETLVRRLEETGL